MKYEQWDLEHAGGGKLSLLPCGLVTKLCSRDGPYPYSYPQDETVLKTPEAACHPQTEDQASKSSMPDRLRDGCRTPAETGPFSLTL